MRFAALLTVLGIAACAATPKPVPVIVRAPKPFTVTVHLDPILELDSSAPNPGWKTVTGNPTSFEPSITMMHDDGWAMFTASTMRTPLDPVDLAAVTAESMNSPAFKADPVKRFTGPTGQIAIFRYSSTDSKGVPFAGFMAIRDMEGGWKALVTARCSTDDVYVEAMEQQFPEAVKNLRLVGRSVTYGTADKQ